MVRGQGLDIRGQGQVLESWSGSLKILKDKDLRLEDKDNDLKSKNKDKDL